MAERRIRQTTVATVVVTNTTVTSEPSSLPQSDIGWVFSATITSQDASNNLAELAVQCSMDGVVWTDLVVFTAIGGQAVGFAGYAKVEAGKTQGQRVSTDSVTAGQEQHMVLPKVRVVADGGSGTLCTIRVDVCAL